MNPSPNPMLQNSRSPDLLLLLDITIPLPTQSLQPNTPMKRQPSLHTPFLLPPINPPMQNIAIIKHRIPRPKLNNKLIRQRSSIRICLTLVCVRARPWVPGETINDESGIAPDYTGNDPAAHWAL